MATGIVVYTSSSSSLPGKHSKAITDYLDSQNIEYDEINLMNNLQAKDTMRQKMPGGAEKNKAALPPQIFTDNIYLGSYDEFFEAKEDGLVKAFLKLPLGQNEEKKLSELQQMGCQLNYIK